MLRVEAAMRSDKHIPFSITETGTRPRESQGEDPPCRISSRCGRLRT